MTNMREVVFMKIICPKCESSHYLEDMIRYVICNLCNTIKCPNCQEWMNEGLDALNYHYYEEGCVLTK